MELIKGGAQVEVAADNVHDYVKKYAEYRMITNSRRALQVSLHYEIWFQCECNPPLFSNKSYCHG